MSEVPLPALELSADVLIIGGGMAAAWAAIAAAREGAKVIVADKGYLGTSGVTAPAGPGHWFVPPDPARRAAAIAQRQSIAFGLGDPRWMARILHETYLQLPSLQGLYEFGVNETGTTMFGAVRGPEYMRALRARVDELGVTVLDQSPALELWLHEDGSVGGASGYQRQVRRPWRVRAAGVVLATGGCAFFSRLLGAQTNTGDGYLMAAEAGAQLSGMEFSSQYIVAPAFSTMARGMSYAWATYYDANGQVLPVTRDFEAINHQLARHLLNGPVFADFSRMPQNIRDQLHLISPNVLPPFQRAGIDPFKDKFPITLIAEGTVRGMGGIAIADEECQTRVPGLYAAGDAASRELVTGASTGGGAVNSAWALSSGYWSGRAAARRATREGRRLYASIHPVGEAGLRPRRNAHAGNSRAWIKSTHQAVTPYETNLFRTEAGLAKALATLNSQWQEIRDHAAGQGDEAQKSREAAAVTATARWCLTAALARRESRGMHTRVDYPKLDPALAARQIVEGLDRVTTHFLDVAA